MGHKAARIRKRIGERLDKHFARDIVLTCAAHMTGKKAHDPNHVTQYPPWCLLLLAKWALLDRNASVASRNLSDRDFSELVRLMHRLAGCVRPAAGYKNPYLLVRNLAFQQFYLEHQRPYAFAMARLGRNRLLLGSLPGGDPLQVSFASLTGVTIEQFLELTMALVTRFLVEGERFVTLDWLEPAQRNYPPGTTQRFLDALSLDYPSVRRWLSEAAGRHSLACEFYEQSPLKRYPLMRDGPLYHCYSSLLLMHSLSFFAYEALRDADPDAFMRRFGPLFERYVGQGVRYLQRPFESEAQLQARLGQGNKVVDFLIRDGADRIYVDAKGVEMAYLGQTSHDGSIVSDKARTSFLKGLRQAYSTAQALEQCGEGCQGRSYLLVVTYKDLYLSNGQAFRDYVDGEAVDRIVAEFGGTERVPLRNVFCCSVDDWDRFVQCSAGKRHYLGPAKLLARYAQADARSARQQKVKLAFGYHVEGSCPDYRDPSYLESAAGDVLGRVTRWFAGEDTRQQAALTR